MKKLKLSDLETKEFTYPFGTAVMKYIIIDNLEIKIIYDLWMSAYSYSIIDLRKYDEMSWEEKKNSVFICASFEDGIERINKKLKEIM